MRLCKSEHIGRPIMPCPLHRFLRECACGLGFFCCAQQLWLCARLSVPDIVFACSAHNTPCTMMQVRPTGCCSYGSLLMDEFGGSAGKFSFRHLLAIGVKRCCGVGFRRRHRAPAHRSRMTAANACWRSSQRWSLGFPRQQSGYL